MDSDNENRREENGDTTRNNLIAKCVMKSITHPLDYARFLVQVSFFCTLEIKFWFLIIFSSVLFFLFLCCFHNLNKLKYKN